MNAVITHLRRVLRMTDIMMSTALAFGRSSRPRVGVVSSTIALLLCVMIAPLQTRRRNDEQYG